MLKNWVKNNFIQLTKKRNKKYQLPCSPFESYMSNRCESSIFREDCIDQEILGMINDLKNGKASDIPIVAIKIE